MDNRLLMSDEQIAGLVIDSRPPRVASRHVELGTMHVKTCIAHLEAIEQRSELDQDVVGHRRVVVPIQPEQGEAIDSYVLLCPPEGPPPLFAGHAPRLPDPELERRGFPRPNSGSVKSSRGAGGEGGDDVR